MGLTKQYLRYLSSCQLGVVASTSSNAIFLNIRGTKARYVAAAACEHVNIWDLRTSKKIMVLQGGKHEVTFLSKSPDDLHIAVGYSDGCIVIFHLMTGDIIITFNGHKSAITSIIYDYDGMRLASGSRDTEVVIWDLVNESGLYRLKGHKDVITSCNFIKEKKFLITSSKDTFVKWWDLDTQHCFKTMVGHRGEIWGFSLSSNDEYLITGSSDSELRMWGLKFDSSTNSELNIIPKLKTARLDSDVESSSDSEDEEIVDVHDKLVTCEKMGSILRKGTDRVMSMKISTNGQVLAVHGNKRDVEIFRLRTKEELHAHMKKKLKKLRKRQAESSGDDTLSPSITAEDVLYPMGVFKCAAKCRYVDVVLSTNIEFKVLALTINNQLEVYTGSLGSGHMDKVVMPSSFLSLHGHRTEAHVIQFSKDGLIIVTTAVESAKIWNRSSQQCIRTIPCSPATSVAFAPGDRQIFIGTKTGKIEILDIASGEMLESIDCDEGSVSSMCLYSDMCGLVTGGSDKTVKFWEFCLVSDENYSQNEKRLSLKLKRKLQLDDEITALDYSSNGKFIAVGLSDCSVKVFYTDTLRFFLSLYGHSLPVKSLSMSTDSTLIATGSSDRNLKIWGLDFGDCHKSVFAHDDTITCVRFIPDTHMVFTSGKDGFIKQWDADKFILIQSLSGHQGPVWSLTVDPEGDYVASCGKDKSIRFWQKSEEILLPEEERENEREEEDEKRLAKNLEATIPGEAEAEETGMASKVTITTIKSTERIMEAIEIYREESLKIQEYKEICKNSKTEVPPRTVHPMLLAYGNIAPEKYVLNVIEKIKRSELDEALLVLSFSYVPDLLKLLNMFVENTWNVELCCRCIFFLLRIHHGQIISNKMMVSLLENLQKNTETQVGKLRDVIGFNMAAMNHLKRELESKKEVRFFADATAKYEDKGRKKKRKIKAVNVMSL